MRDAIRYVLLFLLVAGGLVFILFLPTIIAGMRGHPRLREIRQINLSDPRDFVAWFYALYLALSSRDGVPTTPLGRGWRPSSMPPPDLSPPLPDTPAAVIEGSACPRCAARAAPFAATCLRCGTTLGASGRSR